VTIFMLMPKSFGDGRVLLSTWWLAYDRLWLSNSWAFCYFWWYRNATVRV